MKTISRLTALVSVFVATLCFASCVKDNETGASGDHGLSMTFGTTDALSNAQVIQDMRLFTFYRETGANQYKFRKEIFNLSRQGNTISASIETGKWYLGMLSAPVGTDIIAPSPTLSMESAPMYRYAPSIDASGKSKDAAEIFFTNTAIPDILENTSQTANADIARNVAMVELIIVKATPTFDKSSVSHLIKLYKVPSTISYTGALLPSKTNPDTLSSPLQAKLKLIDSPANAGYLESDTIRFVIPAHKGNDYQAADPTDVTSLKMLVSVDLERVNGTRFTKTKEIPVVAVCNRILRVTITVDDGIEFGTELLKWNKVTLDQTVGENYSNWLYVKKGSTGNGQSWRDALPTINAAVNKVAAMTAAGYTIHGILVAGGSDKIYEEGITVPTNIRIFGGWEGASGTELPPNDAGAPYTSVNRNLSKFKAYLSLGATGVSLPNAGSVLDGFNITGTAPVSVSNSAASMNAVEMQNISLASGNVFSMTGGTATNILVSGCNQGVSLSGAAKLVNATITDNGGLLTCANGVSLLNSVVWWGSKTGGGYSLTGANTIQYCAIQGDNGSNPIPAGTGNVPLSASNAAWFTVGNNIPGPNFNQNTTPSLPYYSAAGDKCPMLRRGNKAVFDNNTTTVPTDYKKDINGNPRFHESIDGTMVSDIGCYEDGSGLEGFQLKWASDRVYISSKNGFTSELPLMLPGNEITDIGVSWNISVVGTLSYCNLTGATSGSGTGVVVGSIHVTPSADYTGNTERLCGTIKVSSNLGAYLPDENFEVWQTPGASRVWTVGYAGSFHRNNETSERLISGDNSSYSGTTLINLTGEWTVRILNGLDWIKIDRNPAGFNGGDVVETWGGVIKGTESVISFRVGLKSTLPAGSKPRYGLIGITRGTGANMGTALFFVRQGEEADYLYGPDDPRALGARTDVIKFSPYNLTDPQGRFATTGIDLGKNGGRFVDYPSKTGYFFKWNDVIAYYPDNSTTGTNIGTSSNYRSGTWDVNYEPCPGEYFTPTEVQWVHSYFLNRASQDTNAGSDGGSTFVWGRIADGYYDRLATNGVRYVGTGPDRATEGLLMYSNYTYASVFFPMAGYRGTGSTFTNDYIQWTQTSTPRATATMWHTHSYGEYSTGHLGMACTQRQRYEALSVRCVKK